MIKRTSSVDHACIKTIGICAKFVNSMVWVANKATKQGKRIALKTESRIHGLTDILRSSRALSGRC